MRGHHGATRSQCYNQSQYRHRSKALRVSVRLFASYRDRTGTAQFDLELPDQSTVARMADSLLEAYPAILPDKDSSRLVVAVNQEYQLHDHVLSDGDEVALIPPVSGGCL